MLTRALAPVVAGQPAVLLYLYTPTVPGVAATPFREWSERVVRDLSGAHTETLSGESKIPTAACCSLARPADFSGYGLCPLLQSLPSGENVA